MTASELAGLRRALITRLRQILKSARPERLSMEINEVGRDWEDVGDEGLFDEIDTLLGELDDRDAHFARKLVDALQRMRDGSYGVCVDCGQAIPLARLQAVPWTERCATDEEIAEKETPHPTL